MTFFNALQTSTTCHERPFRHWEIDRPLTSDMLDEIVGTPIPDGIRVHDGTRAADNGGHGIDGKLRCYVGRDNVHQFPALEQLIHEFISHDTVDYVEHLLHRSLNNAFLRFEIIADRRGFWLKPHKDIREKLMSMLIYANPYGEAENLGTDLYDHRLNLVKTVPYRDNFGYMFAPADNTWHGFEPKEIHQERRSILVNYVTFETDWRLPARRRVAA